VQVELAAHLPAVVAEVVAEEAAKLHQGLVEIPARALVIMVVAAPLSSQMAVAGAGAVALAAPVVKRMAPVNGLLAHLVASSASRVVVPTAPVVTVVLPKAPVMTTKGKTRMMSHVSPNAATWEICRTIRLVRVG
jgi:hypothetical protein